MINLVGFRASCEGAKLVDFNGDYIRVNADNAVVNNCYIKDGLMSEEAHRDAIQIIPRSKRYNNDQYMLASISNLSIRDNIIVSDGALQGIFCSDGLLKDVVIDNNTISTKSQHSITLNGLLSGKIRNNRDGRQKTLKNITLNPARIGGGVGGSNLWVMSFKDGIGYQEIEYYENKIIDNRFSDGLRKRDTYIYDLDLKSFRDSISYIPFNNLSDYLLDIREMAVNLSKTCK